MNQKQRFGQIPSQEQTQKQKQKLRELQELTHFQGHILEQRIREVLAQNPALEMEEEPDFPEDALQEDPEGWNPEFIKPEDEWETGDGPGANGFEGDDTPDMALALEIAAKDHCGENAEDLEKALQSIHEYRLTGRLPASADTWLVDTLARVQMSYSESLPFSPSPVFEVRLVQNRVIAYVVACTADFVQVKGDRYGIAIRKGNEFLEHRRNRFLLLNGIAQHVLEDLQADFFRQKDLQSALLHLLPLEVEEIMELGIPSYSTLNPQYLSKLGDLLVACPLGVFPLDLFWPAKAALRRVWVRAAKEAGVDKPGNIKNWISERMGEWKQTLPHSDSRLKFLKVLEEIKVQDISNAIKSLKHQ